MQFKYSTINFLKILVITISCISYNTVASEIEKRELKMGSVEKLKSKIFDHQRSLLVRLPDNYDQSNKSYPVLYLLNANSFYSGNIYQEAVTLVSRLEKINDIPELIIVGIQSEQWYKDVITDSIIFENYLNQEVVNHIESRYRTLPQRILVGHSYAGAFVSGAVSVKAVDFDLLLSLSPVYPSMAYIDGIRNQYSNLKQQSVKLMIIDGDENPMDKLFLQQAANNLPSDLIDFKYLSKQLDGHMSVLTIGLSHGLREQFSDFRLPSREMVASKPFNIQELKSYFRHKDHKYKTKTDEKMLKSLAISMAHRYTSMGKLELAMPFWHYGESKFKEYFMGGYAERFIALEQPKLALRIWREMDSLFPNSKHNYAKLISQQQTLEK